MHLPVIRVCGPKTFRCRFHYTGSHFSTRGKRLGRIQAAIIDVYLFIKKVPPAVFLPPSQNQQTAKTSTGWRCNRRERLGNKERGRDQIARRRRRVESENIYVTHYGFKGTSKSPTPSAVLFCFARSFLRLFLCATLPRTRSWSTSPSRLARPVPSIHFPCLSHTFTRTQSFRSQELHPTVRKIQQWLGGHCCIL